MNTTPGPDHYMRQYTTEQLRTIVGDPRHYGVGERLDADAILRERFTYTAELRGRRAITRYGERGEITGPALDPMRCTFRPDGEAGVVESITPRIEHLTIAPPAAPAVVSRDPLACRVRWHGVGCIVEGLSDGSYRHTGETTR